MPISLSMRLTAVAYRGGPVAAAVIEPIAVNITRPGVILALTNQAQAETLYTYSIRKIDLTGYSQVRLVTTQNAATASANSPKLSLKYATSFSTTLGNFSTIGTSAVETALLNSANGIRDSGYIDLATGAKADIFIALTGQGGDGTADPSIVVKAFFK